MFSGILKTNLFWNSTTLIKTTNHLQPRPTSTSHTLTPEFPLALEVSILNSEFLISEDLTSIQKSSKILPENCANFQNIEAVINIS